MEPKGRIRKRRVPIKHAPYERQAERIDEPKKILDVAMQSGPTGAPFYCTVQVTDAGSRVRVLLSAQTDRKKAPITEVTLTKRQALELIRAMSTALENIEAETDNDPQSYYNI